VGSDDAALAISDMHFGAWTGEPLLRHQFALDALEPHLEDIDELILLGDVFDFLFSLLSRHLRKLSRCSR
jgi:UDP-2,3-diacylglucosamine pyrophosphatase LpxH